MLPKEIESQYIRIWNNILFEQNYVLEVIQPWQSETKNECDLRDVIPSTDADDLHECASGGRGLILSHLRLLNWG
jgi:hypothetical protein